MTRKTTMSVAIVFATGIAWGVNWRSTTGQEYAAGPATARVSVEVLARGPVHEAFAEPVNLQGFDPLVIEVAPPEPVEELPPEQVPEGDNVQWMSGYWAWDDDRDSFIWVSGVWRDSPPGQRWVSGYWSEAEGSYYWTAGFWVSEEVEDIEYLPEPPETLEVGPQIAAPSDDHAWVPGTWRYQETRYVWRPGYWNVVQPGWVWVPARYVSCPSGYMFVDGYWDYPLEERGVLFAPVYYHEPIYQQASYYYTPTVVIDTEILTVHLFARPRYCHYYFGDYYAPRYREIGIEPWLMFPRIRGCYDPLFHYYGWQYRRFGRGDWYETLHDRYQFFARHEDYRPAHTYAELRRQRFDRIRTGDINIENNIQNIVANQTNLAVNIDQYIQNVEQNVHFDTDRRERGDGRNRMRFARLNEGERRRYVERARDIRGFQERRSEMERDARVVYQGDGGEGGGRGQFAPGDQRERRSLQLIDFDDRRGEPGDPRRGRGRSRAGVAADVPPAPDQTTGAARPRAGLDRTDPGENAGGFRSARQRGREGFEAPRRVGLNDTRTNFGDQQRNEDLRRRQQSLGEHLEIEDSQGGRESTRRGGFSDPLQRDQSNLRGNDHSFGDSPDATGRGFGSGDASDLRNRQLRGRRDENRSPNDPFRQRGFNRDAFGPLGRDNDATRGGLQSQPQEVYRRQLEQLRGGDEQSGSSSTEQMLNRRLDADRQRGVGADAQPLEPQQLDRGQVDRGQVDRGRSGIDVSRGRGSERSPFGDSGQRASETPRRASGSFPEQLSERQAFNVPQQRNGANDRQQQWERAANRGGQSPAMDARTLMQPGGGQRDRNMGRQFRPDARTAVGRGGGDGGAAAMPRLNRGRGGGGDDELRQSNRGGGGRSFSRQQEAPSQVGRGGERGGGGGDERRSGRGGDRGRDRDDDDN